MTWRSPLPKVSEEMKFNTLKFYNPWIEIEFKKNKLPHWEQTGATYFVTWRTADSLPQHFLEQQQTDKDFFLSQHPKPWDTEIQEECNLTFTAKLEEYLDSGHGECLLRNSENADIVRKALLHFDNERYSMISFIVMPNHVHVVCAMHPDWSLRKVIQSWKSQSARLINLANGRIGEFWQKDYFDRIIRDHKHLGRCVRYIRKNPVKAKLKAGEYILYENDLAKVL